jgi:hypothetical protein
MALIILFFCNIWQLNRNNQLKDNDLKYRYIKSISGISSENLFKLERIFKYPREEKKIREIQEKVEKYEVQLLNK